MLFNLNYTRQRLWKYTSAQVPYATATQAQLDEARERINEASERILGAGKWKNTLRRIMVPIVNGYVTLPRELQSMLGIQLIDDNGCCCISSIYTKFHEFAHRVCTCCSNVTLPISETAQVFQVPTAPFTLRVKSTVTVGTIKFIGGWDEDDNEIFTTDTVNITNGSMDGTVTYNVLPPTGGIQKTVTTVPVELYSVDSDGNETLIAVYAPWEQIPGYKRYKVPDWNNRFTNALVFGKLAYVPCVQETDIVIPSNLGAMKIALKALRSEDTEEDESAQKDWARCFNILDEEVLEVDSDAEFAMFRVSPGTGCEEILNLV